MAKYFPLFLFALYSVTASAYFQMDMLKGKKGKGAGTQWTLADWLTQKNRASLMDQWLALHTNNDWFSLDVGGASQQYKFKSDNGTALTSSDKTGQTYQMNLYFSIFNLTGEYSKTSDNKEAYGGAAGLRLLGSSSQSTSLTARYGWRKLTNLTTPESWENQYAEGVLQLYIVEEFGVNGAYRHYFPATSGAGTRLEGHKVTAGVFLEFLIFRIYADYFQEPLQLSKNGVVTRESADGYQGGLKLFF